MKRIIDANLNRACEGLRVIEEISRFVLNDENLSKQLKLIRHEVNNHFDVQYCELLNSRDTEGDIGIKIQNPDCRSGIENIFKANIKRIQEALRVLSEYGGLPDEPRYKIYIIEKQMYERLKMELKKYLLEDKKLYLVTNSDGFENDDKFLDAVALALKGGVNIVQLREKCSDAKRIIELGKRLRQLCSMFNAVFIVNDRIDVAKIVEADGVHLGQDDIDIKEAREIGGENFIIGISTHSPEQALKAVKDGADYIGVGPVFKTPTKEKAVPVGLEYVSWASKNVEIPFFAIGGIDSSNVDEVLAAGAKRIAVVRAIIKSENPENSAKAFINKLFL